MEVILFTGIPASGKTTFYKERFFPSHVYVSLDQLKSRSAERELIDFCFKRQKNCVVDNTNISKSGRARYIALAKSERVKIIGYCFVTDKSAALTRNALREGKVRVPEVAVRKMYKDLEYPTLDEGYDELWYVRLGEKGFVVEAYDEKRVE